MAGTTGTTGWTETGVDDADGIRHPDGATAALYQP